MNESGVPNTRESRVDSAIAEYLIAQQEGWPFDRADWLARYPDVVDELQSYLADEDRFGGMLAPLRAGKPETISYVLHNGPTESVGGPRPAEPITLPSSIGDYEILGEIARGGMGVVFKARQKSLNRIVALKMVLSNRLASAKDIERFQREAEAAAGLDHPNIVPIYEVGAIEGMPFFSMKLIEGGSLQQLKGAENPQAIARLLITVARAVHHAHQRGILHRDLKPSNILIDGEGEPHVADFGLAKRIENDQVISQSGGIVGTPSYMAPEQARASKQPLTTAVDVYGLGAILYELLVGQAPFRGETTADTLIQVLTEEPVRPTLVRKEVPRDLETICLKCLAKEPAKRYSSPEAVAEDLERWLRHVPIKARPVGRVERAVKWVRRNPAIATMAAIFVFALTTVLFVLASSNIEISRAYHARTVALKERSQAAADLEVALRNEQRMSYLRGIIAAQREFQANRLDSAQNLLMQLGPPELRGWEWYYLLQQCNPQPVATFEGTPIAVVPGPPDSDGKPGPSRIAYTRRVGSSKEYEIAFDELNGKPGHSLPLPSIAIRSAVSSNGRFVAIADVAAGKSTAISLAQGGSGHPAFWVPIQVKRSEDGRVVGEVAALIDVSLHTRLWISPCGNKLIVFAHFIPVKPASAAVPRLQVWDVPSGKIAALPGNPGSTDFDVCQELIRIGLHVVSMTTGKLLWALPKPTDGPLHAAFHPDGGRFAMADADVIRVWDTTEWKIVRAFPCPGAGLLKYLPDGRLATVCRDGSVRVIDSEDGREQFRIHTTGHGVNWLGIDPTGQFLVTATIAVLPAARGALGYHPWDRIQVWDLRLYDSGLSMPDYGKGSALGFHSGGFRVGYYTPVGDIRVWDSARREIIREFKGGGKYYAYRVVFSPDLQWVADVDIPTTNNRGARFWKISNGEGRTFGSMTGRRNSAMTFSPDSARVAVVLDTRELFVYDLASEEKLFAIGLEPKSIGDYPAFSPDGNRLAIVEFRRDRVHCKLRIWDIDSRKELASQEPQERNVFAVRWFNDGERIASVGSDPEAAVRIFNWRTGQQSTFPHRVGVINALAISPDQNRIATGASDGTIRIWDVATGDELLTIVGHRRAISAIEFSPDGHHLATMSSDGIVRTWDGRPR